MNYSSTQASNIVSIVGVLTFILPKLGIVNINNEELNQFVSALIVLGGVVWNWIHRYNQGDLTFGGFRKYH